MSLSHHLAHKSAVFARGGTGLHRRRRVEPLVEPLDCLDDFQDTTAGFCPVNSVFEEKNPLEGIIDGARGLLGTRGHGEGKTANVDPIKCVGHECKYNASKFQITFSNWVSKRDFDKCMI